MARRFQRRSSNSQRRKLAWEGSLIGGVADLSVNEVTAGWLRVPAGLSDPAYVPEKYIEEDCTLTRLFANVTFFSSNLGAQINQPWNFAMGVIAWDGATNDVFDITVPPHPALDLQLDWVWRSITGAQQHNIAFTTPQGLSAESKAQRKLSAGTGLLFTAGFTEITGAGPGTLEIHLAGDFRWLIRLP